MRMVDKTKRKERRELGHTALSATHMVIYPDKPGGDDMVKVRLQGTKEDMEWLEKQMENLPNVKITESSETFRNKGTNKYYRKYIEIEKTNQEKEKKVIDGEDYQWKRKSGEVISYSIVKMCTRIRQ